MNEHHIRRRYQRYQLGGRQYRGGTAGAPVGPLERPGHLTNERRSFDDHLGFICEAAMSRFARGAVALLGAAIIATAPARAESEKPLAGQVEVLTERIKVQAQQLARLEAELATLRQSFNITGEVITIGAPRTDRIDLRVGDSVITLHNNRLTIDGKNMRINGQTISIAGDSLELKAKSLTLDSPVINTKGSANTAIKGNKVQEN